MRSNFLVASLIAIVTVTVGVASAEPSPEAATPAADAQCGTSFQVRLVEAQQAILAQEAYMRAYDRVMPWYKANCGLLPEIDRIVHNVKDKYAFTCDSRVRGRPAELSIKFLTEHQAPLPVSAFQAHAAENAQCAAQDPVSLDLSEPPEPLTEATPRQVQVFQLQSTLRRLAVTCHGAQGAKAARCAASRAQNEKLLSRLTAEAATPIASADTKASEPAR
jgi:hypothetical protein